MRLPAVIAVFASALHATPVIARYSAEIRRESASQYIVKVSVQVGGGEWVKPAFTLGPFTTGAFEGCDGCTAQPVGILQRLSPAQGSLNLVYRVAAAPAGEREYIPLAVPEIPGKAVIGSVEVTLLPGEGIMLEGDMFPTFTAASDGRWTASMANMVNHVEFHAGSSRKWLGPRQWSDLAVILMIAGGLLLRAALTRKTRSA